ncbi:MAG TPA: hypothetical protein VGE54_06350 [Brevundimonas sp.]
MPLSTAIRQLSFATSVAAALSITAGCSPQPQSRVCADRAGVRVPDAQCRTGGGRGGGGAAWYYGGAAARTAEGQRVSGGSFKAPRGGFGASARGSSGG